MTLCQIEACPLCSTDSNEVVYAESLNRRYFKCNYCFSWFLSTKERLSLIQEKVRYSEHQNDPKDVRYRDFLSQVSKPLIQKLEPGAEGLDYGCGPGPTLHLMMSEAGFPTVAYDPIFRSETSTKGPFDFITCTEVAEHFFSPLEEFSALVSRLKPQGILAIMTDMVQEETDFVRWYYIKDPSHSFFYSKMTFDFIATQLDMSLEIVSTRVALFTKS